MADLYLNTQSNDPRLLNPNSPTSEDLEDDTPEEVMLPPWRCDLPDCQPIIIPNSYPRAPEKDREILDNIRNASEDLSLQLQRSTVFPFQVQKLCEYTEFGIELKALEDYWGFFVVAPILNLARELSGLGDTVLAIPLTTTTVSPPTLLPQWDGKTVSRKIDFGLAIKLNDDISRQIKNLPRPENENAKGGVGPAATVPILRTHPLFCHIEVKQQYQAVDPIVQLGVWTSAVYTRWEQVKDSHGSSHRDLPTFFGWTIEGCYWHLHLIRRLPNGSRRITEGLRSYDTREALDIYLIITTLYLLINYGHKDFREQFLDSVLDVRVQ